MKIYLSLLNDVTNISREIPLVDKSFSHSNKSFLIYKSMSFVYGTGLVKTVREEIEFVISCQQELNTNVFDVDDFITNWEIQKYIDYDVHHLSGGWRKFLGLALFTNQQSNGKLYFDASRHLSDRLLGVFINNLKLCNDKVIYFFEYDITFFKDYNFDIIYDLGDRFSENKWSAEFLSKILETNYE